ncbi:MAG: DNA methyltransferase, partial [Candidatus Thorarchaeota archaeon]
KNRISQIIWPKLRKEGKSFKISFHTIGDFVKNSIFSKNELYKFIPELGEIIINKTGLDVDLDESFFNFDFIIWDSGKSLIGFNLYSINRIYIDNRAPKHRKFFHPASMNPFLIRAMINSGLNSELIKLLISGQECYFLDPFMGGGGMLLDALDLKFSVIGIDLDYWMCRGTRMNLYDFEKKYVYTKLPWNILRSTSLNIPLKSETVDLIATDPPYGTSSSLKNSSFDVLLENVLKECLRVLKSNRRIVITVPSQFNLPKFIKTDQILTKIPNYVHRSLTRVIWIIEKNE